MANDKEVQGRKLGEVIKKAWDDEAFMQRLLEDATPVLKEHGIQLPAGMKVKAVTNSENLSHLVVPPRPSTMLSDEDMDKVSAGGGGCQGGWNTQDTTPLQSCTGWVRQPSGASRFE
ncbi:MAG: NHLP leader peptide family RiPP precursor [Syntrophus sp. (in: bacteria)]